MTIKSLNELFQDALYLSERETPIFRISQDEVCVGGKIVIPVLKDNTYNNVTQLWKGKLHPESLAIALEHFLKRRLDEGIPFSDSEKFDKGFVLFDLNKMPLQKLFVTPEDNVMIKRLESAGPINFVFGRHLHWHPILKAKLLNPDQSGKLLGRDHPKNEVIEAYEMENIVEAPISPIKIDFGQSINKRMELVPVDIIEVEPVKTVKVRNQHDIKRKTNLRSPLKPVSTQELPQTPLTRKRSQTLGRTDRTPIPSTNLDAFNLMTPPPPPPPMPMGQIGTPPPPPMSFLSPSNPNRKKLRQLHWSRIPVNKVGNTIWGEADSPTKSPLDVNEVELETLFSLSPPKPVEKEKKMNRRQSILDLRKSNNGSILLTQLKMSIKDIIRALECMDDSQFTTENLLALQNLFPLSNDEKKKFKAFKGDTALLTLSEQFYIRSLKVENVEVRIESMLLKKQFENQICDIRSSMDDLDQACSEVQQSKKLAKVLKAILRLGCSLNRSASIGFRLDILPKLSQTKSKDGNVSVLDYLVSKLHEQKSDVLDFVDQMPHIENASKVSLESLKDEILAIGKSLSNIQLEINKCQMKSSSNNVDKENLSSHNSKPQCDTTQSKFYMDAMKSFYDQSILEYQATKKQYSDIMASFHQTVEYFGEDVKTNNPETFFNTFKKFATDFKRSCHKTVK